MRGEDGAYVGLNRGRTPPFTSDISLTFPLESNMLFFLSCGNFAYGSLGITTFDNFRADVQVDIKIEYWSKAALEQATIYKLESVSTTDPKHGIEIITPTTRPRDNPFDNLKFTIDVRIPVSRYTSPHVIKDLYTKLGNFHHDLSDLHQLNFRSVHFEGSNGAVLAEV